VDTPSIYAKGGRLTRPMSPMFIFHEGLPSVDGWAKVAGLHEFVSDRLARRSSSEERCSLGRLDDATCAAADEFPMVGVSCVSVRLRSPLKASSNGGRKVLERAQRSPESTMNNRLYVGNLSFSTTQASIEAAFASAGEVREIAMPTDRETGQPRGFAFVTMGNAQAANSAIAQLNGLMLDGRAIKVNEAQERPARSGGFGGGGGGGYGGGRGRN